MSQAHGASQWESSRPGREEPVRGAASKKKPQARKRMQATLGSSVASLRSRRWPVTSPPPEEEHEAALDDVGEIQGSERRAVASAAAPSGAVNTSAAAAAAPPTPGSPVPFQVRCQETGQEAGQTEQNSVLLRELGKLLQALPGLTPTPTNLTIPPGAAPTPISTGVNELSYLSYHSPWLALI
uniref:Uncharacterized protein n=1 Tax=Xenopus tropicalis TaxID=8364 RepID=A0A1B8Y983_XENTR